MNEWQRKLLAHLHDPPSKPFNIVEHRAIAWSLIEAAFPGISRADAEWFFDKVCDHTAAAADRVICPKSSALKAEWNESASFKHPLGGGELHFEQPIRHAEAETQVARLQPHDCAWDQFGEQKDWAKLFVHWRLWRQRCAEQHPSLAHLPADTRIPDHTIWTHCSIVSALQSCVKIEREQQAIEMRDFQPAFLLVQVGPVQEFIAQARTTRDLWSGSYLLSWLIAHGIKAITDEVGPDCVLFPALRGQPLFDFLHKESLYDKLNMWDELRHSQEQILTPNLPNRFLAVVPEWQAQQLAVAAGKAMQQELQHIADSCAGWLNVEKSAKPRWNQQIAQFLNVHWQTWEWEADVQKAITGHKELQTAHEAATKGIPEVHLDPRNYKHRSWKEGEVWKSEILPGPDGNKPFIENPGFAWAAHYAKVDELLAARRNTRDFEMWDWRQQPGEKIEDALRHWLEREKTRNGAVKDVLSGKEEVVGSEPWQESLANIKGHHFKPDEKLGAMNLIKRIWHRAYLEEKRGLSHSPKFDSLPAIAAASFAKKTWPDPQAADFLHLAHNADDYFENSADDASVFHITEWDRSIKEENKRQGGPRREAVTALQAARDALKQLKGSPGRYLAVIALDGDSMGKWVSGALSPKWKDQLAKEAVEYFSKEHSSATAPKALPELLDTRRHVSPSYHLQLSEALANFALYLTGPIVEHYDGQLIYAGGDDVLAMLPAERALPCAQALRMAFRGDPELPNVFPGALDGGCQPGFVATDGDWEGWKHWEKRFLKRGFHLLVPGQNTDLSAGIAIGHMHSPLQNLVQAARQAEKRAKKEYGKSAFAISLFKRSGETIQWGAKWKTAAIGLAEEFTALTKAEKLSAKFPYALARLLRAYAIDDSFRIASNNGFDPFEVFPAEFAHCVQQQGKGDLTEFKELAEEFLGQCENRRLDDFLGPFLTTTFINRGGGE